MRTRKKKAPAKKKATRASKSTRSNKTAKTRNATKRTSNKRPTAIKTKLTKSQILENISNNTGLTRKEVASVFDEMSNLMGRSIMKNGAGEFVVPGSFKVVTVKKPARKARKGINPFTGEPTIFKARPASVAVKIRPLKGLKDYANT